MNQRHLEKETLTDTSHLLTFLMVSISYIVTPFHKVDYLK
jgi:hypothetical protein